MLLHLQKSDDADYNQFLETLSNRRRQIADANPKSLAPSVLSHSVSNSSLASNSSTNFTQSQSNNEIRSTKPIIIGAGQPIVIPGQTNITNDPKIRQQMISQVTSSIPFVSKPTLTVAKPAPGIMASLFGAKSDIQDAVPVTQLGRMSIAEHKVISVDEFCPDGGGGLDRGFLDDDPSQTSGSSKQAIGGDDSDTDSETGNPMVARFHDEPSDADSFSPMHLPKSVRPILSTSTQPKVNPLAKSRPNAGNILQTEATTTMRLDYFADRKSSLSSDDIEVPTVLATNIEPIEKFDSWMSSDEMTSRRRSPEGGEDVSVIVGTQPEPIATRTDSLDEDKVNQSRLSSFCFFKLNFHSCIFSPRSDTKANPRRSARSRRRNVMNVANAKRSVNQKLVEPIWISFSTELHPPIKQMLPTKLFNTYPNIFSHITLIGICTHFAYNFHILR